MLPKSLAHLAAVLLVVFTSAALTAQEPIVIQTELVHLRQTAEREWDEFPEVAEAAELSATFLLGKTFQNPVALCFEQQDVKQTWKLSLNGADLGTLTRDENPMRRCLEIPPDKLTRGLNEIRVSTSSDKPDDIRIGRITLHPQTRPSYLGQCPVSVKVTDDESKSPLPCRITILNSEGALQETSADSSNTLAVRTGVIYTANGEAAFGLPPGKYTFIAGRGPEYGMLTATRFLTTDNPQKVEFELAREVDTAGWVASDTHVHTLTLSGHGDSTLDERMITIAGEGIELPIATEHNKQVDYAQRQQELGLAKWYTPVTGNEVTTKWGHFNIWPVTAGGPVPDFKQDNWKDIFQSIQQTADPEIIILNHSRDLHSGYRPFGIKHRNPLTGRRLDGWTLEANAMEVVNSGAQQTDILQLPRDWMACLNRGQFLTPVGCSDSHDVARHFVGQGRTYIKADDTDPGNIDVAETVRNFRAGRVIVSCGLFPQITLQDKYGPGDLVPFQEKGTLNLVLEIDGPEWCQFDHFEIYINGERLPIVASLPAGIERPARQTISIPAPPHDAHIVCIALGPGVRSLHWPIAKPYQPDDTSWKSLTFGMTGAVWYDGNNDGKKNSAHEIAASLWKDSGEDPKRLLEALQDYDRAVCLQAAEIVHLAGHDLQAAPLRELWVQANSQVRFAFRDYWEAWRTSEVARRDRLE